MYEKYKESLEYINNSSIVRQQLFMVELKKNDNSIVLNPIEIEYFHEEPKKKVVLKVRYHSKNLIAIDQISKLRHKYLPNCLVSKNHKFNIDLILLTPLLKENYRFMYENCVLTKVTYPMFFYGKGSDNVATAYFEFRYSNKKSSCNDIDVNENLKHKKITRYSRHNTYEDSLNYLKKSEKILEYSNQMLDDALKTTEKYYKNHPDKKCSLENVRRCIENAKSENKHKHEYLKKKGKNSSIYFVNSETDNLINL